MFLIIGPWQGQGSTKSIPLVDLHQFLPMLLGCLFASLDHSGTVLIAEARDIVVGNLSVGVPEFLVRRQSLNN